MNLEKLSNITKNLDNRRRPLNSIERDKISKQGLYPYIGANNIMGYVDEYLFDEKILCLAEDGGNWNAGQKSARIFTGKTWVNNHAHVLVENGSAHLEYVMYFLNYTDLTKYISGSTRGKLTKSAIEKIMIPLPPYEQQVQIATLLSKIEGLIEKRKRSIELIDEYVRAVFLEMFGDPVRNEKGWDTYSLHELGEFKNGLNYSKNEIGNTYKSIGVSDFKDKWMLDNINSLNYISLEISPKIDFFLNDGDLLFVRSNGNKDLVGRCMVVYPKNEIVTFSGFCIRFRTKTEIANPIYLAHLFRNKSLKSKMLNDGRGANIQNVTQEILNNFKIPLPLIIDQNEFEKMIRKQIEIKGKFEESLRELEKLYGSVSKRVFRGPTEVKIIPYSENEISTNNENKVSPKWKSYKILRKILLEFKVSNYFTFEDFMNKLNEKEIDCGNEEIIKLFFSVLDMKEQNRLFNQFYSSEIFNKYINDIEYMRKLIKAELISNENLYNGLEGKIYFLLTDKI